MCESVVWIRAMAMAACPAAAAATASPSFCFSLSHLSPFRPAVVNLALSSSVVRRLLKPSTHFHSSHQSRGTGTHLVREQQCACSGVFSLGRNSVQVRAQAEESIEEGPFGDEDICELVNGYEVGMEEAAISGYYIQALKNNNGAGILVLTDVFGFRNNATRDFVLRLACFGYNVFIPDLFRENPWDESVPPTGEEFEAWRMSHTVENLSEDIDMATQWLKSALDEQEQGKKPPKYAVLGFCMGGGLAVQTAAKSNAIETFSAAVSFYGSRIDLNAAKNIKMPLLLITGDQDELSPVTVCKKLESMLQETKLIVYPGRGHGFAHRPDSMDDDDAAEDAFTALRTWLKEKLLLRTASVSH